MFFRTISSPSFRAPPAPPMPPPAPICYDPEEAGHILKLMRERAVAALNRAIERFVGESGNHIWVPPHDPAIAGAKEALALVDALIAALDAKQLREIARLGT